MDQFHFVTSAECPDHAGLMNNRLWVVVSVDADGGLDIWKGCQWCPDAAHRLQTRKPDAEAVKP